MITTPSNPRIQLVTLGDLSLTSADLAKRRDPVDVILAHMRDVSLEPVSPEETREATHNLHLLGDIVSLDGKSPYFCVRISKILEGRQEVHLKREQITGRFQWFATRSIPI